MKLLSHIFNNTAILRATKTHVMFGVTRHDLERIVDEYIDQSQYPQTFPPDLIGQWTRECTLQVRNHVLFWFAVEAQANIDPADGRVVNFIAPFPPRLASCAIHMSGIHGGKMEKIARDGYNDHRLTTDELLTMEIPLIQVALPNRDKYFDPAVHGIKVLDWE